MEREPVPEVGKQDMTAGDFVLGVIHNIAKNRGGKYWFDVRDGRLHSAFEATQSRLLEIAEQHGVDPDFRVGLDSVHGDSAILRHELTGLLFHNSQVQGVHGSYVRLIYDAEHPLAEHVEEILPGPAELYEELAAVFTVAYENRTRTT